MLTYLYGAGITKANSVDYKIEWLGEGTVWVDKIIVKDTITNRTPVAFTINGK